MYHSAQFIAMRPLNIQRKPPLLVILFILLLFILSPWAPGVWAEEPSELEIGKGVPDFNFKLFDRKGSGVEYKAEIFGLEDQEEALELVKSVSDVFSLIQSPPPSLNLLRVRMEDDIGEMKKALGYCGFFKAVIKARIDSETDPPTVHFDIDPGPPFILTDLRIVNSSPASNGGLDMPKPGEVGLLRGRRYYGGDVVKAQEKILTELGRKGRPYPRVVKREIIADHASNKVNILFEVDPGKLAVYGPVSIEGLEEVDEQYIKNLIPWREGEIYNIIQVKEARTNMIETGLFSSAEITLGEVDDDNALPLTMKFKERPFRTVRAGVEYQTDLGPGGKLSWENRNILGGGERLTISLDVNQVEQTLGGSFRKPFFLDPSQALVITTGITDESSEAYESRSFEVLGALERTLSRNSLIGFGPRYRFITEDEKTRSFGLVNDLFNNESLILDPDKTYMLVSFPVYFKFNNSDDLFDPGSGGRLGLHWEPFTDAYQNSPGFWKLQASYSHYFELISDRRLVMAGKVVWGAVGAESRDDVPSDELMYSGGGGSVRGYAYQTAGDLDEDDEPLGGLSKLEVSFEARTKITKSFGLAAFLDGGRAFANEIKDPGKELYWGGGGGIRYYSPIGPFRADIAFPLNKRKGVDPDYQIYVSLGQSF